MPSARCIKRFKELLNPKWVGLDVGCGSTWLAKYGVDFARRGKLTAVADLYQLPFRDKVFDYVASAHVIEHLENPVEAVKEMARVAKHVVIANIPRYTRKVEETAPCVGLDTYYFSEHIDEIDEQLLEWFKLHFQAKADKRKMGLKEYIKQFWGGGHTHFGPKKRHAPHRQWFPNPKDCYELFEKTECFKKIHAEVCGSCGESNVLGRLKN